MSCWLSSQRRVRKAEPGALGGPVACDEVLFLDHELYRLLRAGNTVAMGGLTTVAAAVSMAVALVVLLVEPGTTS
jgi:hypothetical protein